MRTRPLATLIATLLAAFAASSASAAPWVGGEELLGDPDHQGGGVTVRFDGGGTAHAAWIGEGDDAASHVYSSRRSPGDTSWSAREEISGPGAALGNPAITVSASNDVTVAWSRTVGGVTKIETSTRLAATGEWTSTDRLSDTPGGNNGAESTDPVLLTDRSGVQTLIWREYGGHVVAARRAGQGGQWPAGEIVSGSLAVSNPRAIVDDGDITVAFTLDSGSGSGIGTTTYDSSQSTWSVPESFSKPGGAALLKLVSDGAGGQVATWFADPGPDAAAWVLRRSAGSSWDAPVDAASDDWFDVAPSVAPLGGGDLLVSWLAVDLNSIVNNDLLTVHAGTSTRIFSASGGWGELQQVTPVADASWGLADLVPLPSGAIAGVAQTRVTGARGIGITVRDSATGAWADPAPIPGSSVDLSSTPVSQSDLKGNVAIAWTSTASGRYSVHAAIADFGPPQVSALSVPDQATTGEEVPVSAEASDDWSEMRSVRWDFGDGTSATGESPSHTFAATGEYRVSVTATDAAGNSATRSSVVSVTDPPAPAVRNDPPPVVTPPLIEARLSGRTITLNAKLALKKGKRCSGSVKATTAFGGKTYKTTLRLSTKNGACRATGTIKLKKTPSLRTKLRVTVSGAQAKSRTLTTRRG
ncbi:MAG: PKD domain-containing protein [Baekduia sp.]